jgi:hypothetical protein
MICRAIGFRFSSPTEWETGDAPRRFLPAANISEGGAKKDEAQEGGILGFAVRSVFLRFGIGLCPRSLGRLMNSAAGARFRASAKFYDHGG